MEEVNLHAIVEEAESHIQLILENKKGVLNNRWKAKEALIYGNKSHLTNIVVNLLDNAVKYCEKQPKIALESYNEDGYILLKVKDNGIGMTPSIQKKVFDKFYRATSGNIHNVKGHGLGLAYVKKIIDLHKGTIHLESKKNVGTIFTITLPLKK
jgi:two-component system phosphate regulon sensor histidine kinase PhoR